MTRSPTGRKSSTLDSHGRKVHPYGPDERPPRSGMAARLECFRRVLPVVAGDEHLHRAALGRHGGTGLRDFDAVAVDAQLGRLVTELEVAAGREDPALQHGPLAALLHLEGDLGAG